MACGTPEWPCELLDTSDIVHCRVAGQVEQRIHKDNEYAWMHTSWAPPRYADGNDAGIVATAPSPVPPGCWPNHVSRTAAAKLNDGFFVATCAPANTNEMRRTRFHAHGEIGGTCSRAHQTFMNTTRKCTGTHDASLRQACQQSDGKATAPLAQ